MKIDQNELGIGSPTDFGTVDESAAQKSRLIPKWIRELVETLLLAGLIWFAFNLTTARFVVEGNSMEPNVHTGEFILTSRLAYFFGEPSRGDIVVFRSPLNPEEDFIKRIIGLPGDMVKLENGDFFINGARLDEPFDTIPTRNSNSWTVGADQFFVVGDNRANSSDSRSWGPLDADLIIGKAWLVYWPPSEWGTLPHQEYASQ